MALRAHDLPDPAKWRPQDPVSDVAISLTASEDSMAAASRDDELWAAEEAGVLDVVEARAKGVRLIPENVRLKGGQRLKIARLQEHLNRLLLAARSWNTTKEAKVCSYWRLYWRKCARYKRLNKGVPALEKGILPIAA